MVDQSGVTVPSSGDGRSGVDHANTAEGGGQLTSLSGIQSIDLEAESGWMAAGAGASAGNGAGSSADGSSIIRTVVPGLVEKHRYKITGEFARGGMGRILLAFDRATGREVAIKELIGSQHEADPAPAGGKLGATGPTMMAGPSMVAGKNVPGAPGFTESPPPDEITVERFLREAKITSRLEHPNIVPVYEIAQRPDGVWYYTMKFVRGVTLSKKLRDIQRDSKLDAKAKLAERIKLLGVFIDVCNAVAFAHSKGVVHRDLKPDNIMVGEFGETVVLDWGLAHVEGEDNKKVTQILSTKALKTSAQRKLEQEARNTSSSSARLTMMGSVVGTPSYMPPEQAMGKLEEVDETSDTYALGAILYELLSGQRAYPGDDAYDILDAVLAGPPKALPTIAPEIPPELVAVVERAMARDKSGRFASAHDLGSELRAWRDGRAVASYKYSTGEQIRRIAKRHRAVVGTISAALLVLLIGGTISILSINSEKEEAERQAKEASEQRTVAEKNRLSAEEARAAAELSRQRADDQRRTSDEALAKVRELEQQAKDRFGIAQRERIVAYTEASALARANHALKPAIDRAMVSISAWEADKQAPILAAQKIENEQCMAALTAAIQAHSQALRLATDPIENQPPRVLSHIPHEDESLINSKHREIGEAKQAAARLALANRDHGLARYLVTTIDRTEADQKTVDALKSEVEAGARAILEFRKSRIVAAIDDVKRGMMRPERKPSDPILDDYVFELAGYRDHQTVDLLKVELEALAELAKQRQLETKGLKVKASLADHLQGFGADVLVAYESWSASERDLAKLCLRVLPRLQLPDEAVDAIKPLAASVLELQMLQEVIKALSDIGTERSYLPIHAIIPRVEHAPYCESVTSLLVRAIMRLPEPGTDPLKSAEAYRARAFRNGLLGRREEQLADARAAYALDNSNIRVLAGLIRALLQSKLHSEAMEMIDKYETLQPKPGEAAFLRAQVFGAQAKFAEALAEVDKAIAADGKDYGYLSYRSVIHIAMKNWQEAITSATAALRLSPAFSEALTNRATAWDRLGEKEKYEADINRLLQYDPWNVVALRNRFVSRAKRGDFQAALDDISRCIELEPDGLSLYLDRAHLQRADLKNPSAALLDAQTVLDVRPRYALALIERGRARRDLGETALALEDAEQAIAIGGSRLAEAYELRGYIRKDGGDTMRAIEDFTKAIELENTRVHAFQQRGLLYRDEKDFEKALSDHREAVRLAPDAAQHHHNLAICLRAAGKDEEALVAIDTAINMAPLSHNSLSLKASLYANLKRYPEAIETIDKALALDPENAAYWGARGHCNQSRGELAEAVRDFERSCALDGSNAVAWRRLGQIYFLQGNMTASIAACEKACEAEPEDANTWIFLGMMLENQGRSKEAVKALDRGISLDQKNAAAFNARAKALESLWEFDRAEDDYNRAVELGEKNHLTWLGRSIFRESIGDFAGALADRDQALKLDPDKTGSYYSRSFFRYALGDKAGADEDLAAYTKLSKNKDEIPGKLAKMTRLRRNLDWMHKEPVDPVGCLAKAEAILNWDKRNPKQLEIVDKWLKAAFDGWKTPEGVPPSLRTNVLDVAADLGQAYYRREGRYDKSHEWQVYCAQFPNFLTDILKAECAYNAGCYAAEWGEKLAEAIAGGKEGDPAKPEETVEYWKDLAFEWLNKCLDGGWHNSAHLEQDSDWNFLHDDPRWAAAVRKCKMLEAKAAKEKRREGATGE